MNKKLYDMVAEKIDTLNTVKDVLYTLENSYQYDYEYETDEEGNKTWKWKKDENGEPIRHLQESRYNKMIDELREYLTKKYL